MDNIKVILQSDKEVLKQLVDEFEKNNDVESKTRIHHYDKLIPGGDTDRTYFCKLKLASAS